MYELFQELNLQVTELPVEFEGSLPVYRAFIRELPFIAGSGSSRQAVYRQLAEGYQAYAESQLAEAAEEAGTTLLSTEQLLKYYDGELFADFGLADLEEE